MLQSPNAVCRQNSFFLSVSSMPSIDWIKPIHLMEGNLFYSKFVDLKVKSAQSVMSDSLRPHGPQHARLPCPAPTPGAHSNSCPLSQ